MAWQDRLREAAYTSPSGSRLTFKYMDVSRVTPLRSTIFEFPDVDGGYVQQNGHGPRRYPLRCFFVGADHDLDAAAFEAALVETGLGKLEHPLYGTFTVVPVGEVTRRDDLREAANQSVVEVEFVRTLDAIYPTAETDQESEITSLLDEARSSAGQQFADATTLASALHQANAKATIRRLLNDISASLDKVASATSSVEREYQDIKSILTLGLEVLIEKPLDIADQVADLFRSAAASDADIQTRIAAYDTFIQSVFDSSAGRPADGFASGTFLLTRRERIANDFHISDLFVCNALAGSVQAVIETEFETRPQAVAAAASILTQLDAVIAWRDACFETLTQPAEIGSYQIDTGVSHQAIQDAVSRAAGMLISVSWSLVPERRIALDRQRTIIDLCAELYGNVDEKLDFLIASNQLTGSEILELPAGRVIRYYV